MTLDRLRELLTSGQFHHATYRNHGTCFEGLFIYVKAKDGFRGFRLEGSFANYYRDRNPECDTAYAMVRDYGVSFGSYGQG